MNRFYESKLELEKLLGYLRPITFLRLIDIMLNNYLDPSSKEIEECKERLTFWSDQMNFVKQNQLKFVSPQSND